MSVYYHWHLHRRDNDSINLWEAWKGQECANHVTGNQRRRIKQFLQGVEELQLIRSRQAAAIALQCANMSLWSF